jgi:death-on-curing protein
MSGRPVSFLTLADILKLHEFAIEDQGGDPHILSPGLLESAIAMPEQQFGGEYLHPTIPAMAAAYAFHICKNHAFADGNKRAALAAMTAFLVVNDCTLDATNEEAEDLILRLASGKLDKDTLTTWVTSRVRSL